MAAAAALAATEKLSRTAVQKQSFAYTSVPSTTTRTNPPPALNSQQNSQQQQKNAPRGRDRRVRICFYEPRAANEHWLNRIVASLGTHFVSHCEILFEDEMAASIFADETVFFRKRTYANPNYVIKCFTVSNVDYHAMYNYARTAAQHGIKFSNAKMVCGPLIGYTGDSQHTYCSEFVTRCLQVGNVPFAMRMQASRSTPSNLLERMNSLESVCFDTTSFKLEQMVRQ